MSWHRTITGTPTCTTTTDQASADPLLASPGVLPELLAIVWLKQDELCLIDIFCMGYTGDTTGTLQWTIFKN